MKKYLPWILVAYICFVFIQSLFFKFAGSIETVIIFDTIGDWMGTIGLLAPIGPFFKTYGGYLVGGGELVAAFLLLTPKTRLYGAVMALCVMSGAIFFHLFTPLGVDRAVDMEGNTDGGVLFYMACGVWLSSLALIFLSRPNNAENV